jgi:tetratricopeptide (TPR) repeat protein
MNRGMPMATVEPTIPATGEQVPYRTIQKIIVLLILIGGLAYCNSLTKPFHLDDTLWISNNSKIGNLGEYVDSMRSRPGIALLFHLHYRLHGLNLFGYHLVNLLIHVAAALTLFGIVRRTLLLSRWDGRFASNAHWLAFAVALLWMVHPLQTQAVTYIIQRCESLMGLFYLLSMYAMIRGTQSQYAGRWYALSIFCAVLAASCKEVIVTILPVMLCYDYVFIGSWRDLIRKRWWLYLGLAGIWMLPLLATMNELTGAESASGSAGFAIPNMPAHVYMMTQAGILLHYLRLAIVPYPQSFSFRGWPLATEFADVWLAGSIMATLMLLTAWFLLRRNWIGFLGAWFFGILSITSIVPLIDVGFEHRMYLPLAAISCLVVMMSYFALEKYVPGRVSAMIGVVLLTTVACILLFLTLSRNEDYRSTEVLWKTVTHLYPKDAEAHNNVASGLVSDEKLEDAREYYELSLALRPGLSLPEFGYGIVLCKLDEPEEGLRHLLIGLKSAEHDALRKERYAESNYFVGIAYWILGDLQMAEKHQRLSIQHAPKKAAPYGALALVLHQQDQIRHVVAAVSAVSNHPYGASALVLNQQSQNDEVRANNAKALELAPTYPDWDAKRAGYFLHGYPSPSKWVHKEALFHASVAAQATDYKNLNYVATLAEAYAENQRYPEAIYVIQNALKSVDASANAQQRAQLERFLVQCQSRLKNTPEKKDKN